MRSYWILRCCFIPHRNYRLFTIYKKFPGKSGWKPNGTLLFESFQRKISGRDGTSEKVVLSVFWTEYSQRKFVFHFSKAVFDTSFRRSQSLQSLNWLEGNLPVLNFAYHLPKPWTRWFAHVNGKQPPNSNIKEKTKWSLVLVVKRRHRANGLITYWTNYYKSTIQTQCNNKEHCNIHATILQYRFLALLWPTWLASQDDFQVILSRH